MPRYRSAAGNRRAWNNRAGANIHSRDVRGQHTPNAGFKPSENWVECQRCGMDIRAQHAREDGYKEGLIVCPTCYDPPHPQDYVHAFDDEIAPGGFSTGVADYDRTGAEGSTEVPGPTGTIGSDPLNPNPPQAAAPDELGCDIFGWWDFATNAYAYSDDPKTTLVTNGDDVLQMESRATPQCSDLAPSFAANQAPWYSNVRNGNGAWLPQHSDNEPAGNFAGSLGGNNPFSGMFGTGGVLPMTVVGFVEMAPTSLNNRNRSWFGTETSSGHQIGLEAITNEVYMQTQRTNPTAMNILTAGGGSQNAYVGDWHMWLCEFDGVSTNMSPEINNAPLLGGAMAHDYLDLPTGAVNLGSQNIATFFDNPHWGWGAYIGEIVVFACILTDAQKESLYLYGLDKWNLSAYPP